ncbi:MAG: hypothetical protein JXA96_10180 [Sedimentisphaerales bacterium]|nr:hypothetical protein [Sedimentisphaerales bacterium]
MAMTKKHLENCESCKHFYNVTNFMESALPAEARLITKDFSSEANDQIMQNITEYKMNPVPFRMNLRPIAVAAGIVYIFLISTFFLPSNPTVEEKDRFNEAITEFSNIVNLDKGASFAGVIQGPIQTELENIVGDIKSVAQFLFTCVDINVDIAGKIDDSGEGNANPQK